MQPLKALLIYCAGALFTAPALMGGIEIHFDYRFDGSGFFSGANLQRREILEAAAKVFEERITSHSGAIIPQGVNRWSLNFPNPSTGEPVTINNPTLPADSITVYVGARDMEVLGAAEVSVSYVGFQFWVDLIASRNTVNRFEPWGGSIAFDSDASWHFDDDVSTLESFPGKFDFYSVAVHELGHLLGFGLGSRAFAANIAGSSYVGARAVALFGGPVPLAGPEDLQHWRQGFQFEGRLAAMSASTNPNKRTYFTELEFAILKDIGYSISEPVLLNQPPSFLGLADRLVIDEDSAETIAFQISDPDTSVDRLLLEVSSDNAGLIDETGLAFNGDGTERQLRLAPKRDAFGEANVEVRLSDGDFNVSHFVELVVVAVNDPPMISEIPDVTIAMDQEHRLTFTAADPESGPEEIFFSFTSKNQQLLDSDNLEVTGNGEEKTLIIRPKTGQSGEATIALFANDPARNFASRQFKVTVEKILPENISLSIRRSPEGLEILWNGKGALQQADFVDGSFSDVPNATSPFVIVPEAD